jgi:hypothetical protein
VPTVPGEKGQGLLKDLPDSVIVLVSILGALLVAWFALKALARRGRLVGAYQRLDPVVQAIRAWVLGAPATFAYMAVWTSTSVVQQGTPAAINRLTAALSSTNIHNLVDEPVRVLFTSAVLVANHAAGFMGYVVIYVLIVARLEHRVGSARWMVIAASAHILGTLLTVALEKLGLELDVLPDRITVAQDIGVSYVMVGAMGAYLWLVSPRWRWPYRAALAVGVLGPLVVFHTIWDLGHLLAALVGTFVGWIALRYPTRDPLLWRQLVGTAVPRVLPTFDATVGREPVDHSRPGMPART